MLRIKEQKIFIYQFKLLITLWFFISFLFSLPSTSLRASSSASSGQAPKRNKKPTAFVSVRTNLLQPIAIGFLFKYIIRIPCL